MNGKQGALCFVLHSHIPYVRGTGPWPHGEVWLYEAIAETYIPLLKSLGRLQSQLLPVQLTLSLTPVLLEQLADERIKSGFMAYAGQRAEAAEADRRYLERSGQPAMQALAERHLAFYRESRRAFESRFAGDLVSAFGRLQEDGVIEVATSAATHGYLPLLGDASVRLQLRTAVAAYQRHFGRNPAAIWLPECGYRPGLEGLLEASGLCLFFAETFMVTGGQPAGVADQSGAGAYASLNALPEIATLQGQPQLRSAHHAYYVDGSQVAVLGRDETTGSQVWSGAHGYPGDGAYREFHKQHRRSGLRYWRVTDHSAGLDQKQIYDEKLAARRMLAHANHFTALVEAKLNSALESGEESPVLVAAYDTELFGHWWAEGVPWLEAVMRRLGSTAVVNLVSASGYVDAYQPETSVIVPEGSWGVGGGHYVWNNQANSWIWPEIASAESRLANYANQGELDPARKRLLDQAARELLLMQASDWPFLMTSGQAAEFASERFAEHHARFEECLAACESATVDRTLAPALWEEDRVFPEMDYRWLNP
jgi:1,4-alpha-glucan branching enzyme